MPGATNIVKVDGVEPSILIKLLNIPSNPERVKIFTSDDGDERYIYKENEEPVWVTGKDLGILGSVGIEVLGRMGDSSISEFDQTTDQIFSKESTPEGVVKAVDPPSGLPTPTAAQER